MCLSEYRTKCTYYYNTNIIIILNELRTMGDHHVAILFKNK